MRHQTPAAAASPTSAPGTPPPSWPSDACSIGHRQPLLLSSANLTEHAFTTNMELGVLITGGRLPGDVERQFDRLIQRRVLVPIARE